MSLSRDFVPTKPFPDFKWKWACLACTEGLNDPVVLLGVLFRMRKLELLDRGIRYSSAEFGNELKSLAAAVKGRGVINVDLGRRTGERNLIRNSGQYWSALGLIPVEKKGGVIQLTQFGRQVADRKISQTEFAALTIQTFTLPNKAVQSEEECKAWDAAGLRLKPLLLLLKILLTLDDSGQGCLTKTELLKIVIPLSAARDAIVEDYVAFIKRYRAGDLELSRWPDCCPKANDHRIATEFLLFLENYGYVNEFKNDTGERFFSLNAGLRDEIETLVKIADAGTNDAIMATLKASDVVQEIERKRVQQSRTRPNQARFRREVLGTKPRCIITNVTMPEVLEAAHIVPYKYHGEDTMANGFCMRMDIHQLFDSGHLRIREDGEVVLSDRARIEYGALIPPFIRFPDYVKREFVRWRWENYNGM